MRGGRSGRVSATIAIGTGAVLLGLSATPAAHATTPGPATDQLRLNQIQVIGTHNSYHLEATAAESRLRALIDPTGNQALLYSHPALRTQFLNQDVRQIELDVWADPQGGLYAKPLVRTLTLGGPYDRAMKKPGTKVLHIQDIDYHSNCLTFRRCLQAVKGWSRTHPTHVPIAVLVEFKDSPLSLPGLRATRLRQAASQQTLRTHRMAAVRALPFLRPVTPLPWTSARMDTIDADIRSVFEPGELITPDDVRGDHPTLEDAVLSQGWPTLAAARGKTLFLMDNTGAYRVSYLAGHPSLAGRVLFTNSTPGQPDAAFVEENDPTGATNQARIQNEVRRGYVVRTRADVDTAQARTNDTSMRDAALASGAQWVSTDYPVPSDSARFGTGYAVQLPGALAARCNPVNAPADCTTIATP
jgi:hypothetical protein